MKAVENLREKAWGLKQKNSNKAGDAVEADEDAVAADELNKQGMRARSSESARRLQKMK